MGIFLVIDTNGDGVPGRVCQQLGLPRSPGSAVARRRRGSKSRGAIRRWSSAGPRSTRRSTPTCSGTRSSATAAGSLQVFADGTLRSGFLELPARTALDGGVDSLNPLYVCSPLLSPSTSSYRVKILQNDIVYGVGAWSRRPEQQREHAGHLLRHPQSRPRASTTSIESGHEGAMSPTAASLAAPPAASARCAEPSRRAARWLSASALGVSGGDAGRWRGDDGGADERADAWRALRAGAVWRRCARRAPRGAQSILENEAAIVEGEHPISFAQKFAVRAAVRPLPPQRRRRVQRRGAHPYQDYFGTASDLLTQIEFDYEFFHGFGTLGGRASAPATSRSRASRRSATARGLSERGSVDAEGGPVLAVGRLPVRLLAAGATVPAGALRASSGSTTPTGRSPTATARSPPTARAGGARGHVGWHAAGGLALVLDLFDPESARDFDADLGVNHTALCSSTRTPTSPASGSRSGSTWATRPGRSGSCSSFERRGASVALSVARAPTVEYDGTDFSGWQRSPDSGPCRRRWRRRSKS